jgi:hypothetical protein
VAPGVRPAGGILWQQGKGNMFRYTLVVLAGLCAAGPASASWADSLFDETSRDFGTVPRGPTVTHPFRVVNRTNGPVHIGDVRVSCGRCVSARPLQNVLAPGQETAILVHLDTTRFDYSKTFTVDVPFTHPQLAEVRLTLQAHSRADITLIPETLAFGKVKRGAGPTAETSLSFLGNPNWRVLEVTSDSNYVQPKVEEVRRNSGEVTYKLTATLRKDTPPGKWYTDVWLKANSDGLPRIRVPLSVDVEAPVSVTPMSVVLGEVKAGAQAERHIVIRAGAPFRITGIKGTDAQLSVRDSSQESKNVHVITVTLRPTEAGELNRTLQIQTDLQDEALIEVSAKAKVIR